MSPTKMMSLALALTIVALMVVQAVAQHPQLKIGLTLDTPSTGVSTTPDGRLFILYARIDGSTGPQIVEWKDNNSVPYPDEEVGPTSNQ